MMANREPIGVQRRWSILHRDDFTCAFCGARPGNHQLHVDHLIPHSVGGIHDDHLADHCTRTYERARWGGADAGLTDAWRFARTLIRPRAEA